MALTQDNRLLRIYGEPFTKDNVLLTGISGQEALSRLYSFQLEFVCTELELNAATLIGKPIKIEIAAQDGSDEIRYINGFISRLSAGEVSGEKNAKTQIREYRAELVPWLWFLTQTARCFIFFPEKEDKSIYEIIEAVITRSKDELGIANAADVNLEGINNLKNRMVKHCVQYRETDFNFLSRILEQYGAYYYFKQSDGKHEMYLSSDKKYPAAAQSSIKYPKQTVAGKGTGDHIQSWERAFEFVSGKWTHTDYNFEKPLEKINAESPLITAKHPQAADFEIYDYPGEYATKDDGNLDARIRQEEEEVPHDSVHASSVCRALMPGHTFQLEKREDGSIDSEVGSYLVTSIQHHAGQPGPESGGGGIATYSNSFRCIPDSIQFRAARVTPKPVVSGIQTAVVVGKHGQEIETDPYGRIKVAFHWDREDEDRQQKSRKKIENGEKFFCWVRVAQNVAGKGWGFLAIPRIGQEVVVDFLEGDPDQPLVVGSVYNEEQKPPYNPDEHKTRTCIKTNSSPGGDGFNELFFDDEASNEQVFIHAQRNYDQRIRNHSTEHVGGNMHLIVGKDDAEHGGEVEIDIEKSLKRSVGLDGIHLTNEGDEMKQTGGSQHLSVSGDWNSKAMNISSEAEMDIHSKAAVNYAVEGGVGVHIKGGVNVVVEAGLTLTLKVGGNYITIDPSGVTIKGAMVVIDGAMTRINSGPGSPAGSGTGCSPKPPEAPEKAEPNQAHREQTGQKSAP